jgi:hypothetical protein
MQTMPIIDRLDRITGNLAAVESAFMLLALRLSKQKILSLDELIGDMDLLAQVPGKDLDIAQAEQRMIDTLQRIQSLL